eukprot:g16003.t1
MRRNTEKYILRKQDLVAKEVGRTRKELFKTAHSVTIERMQNAIFPMVAKRLVFVASLAYAVLVVSVAIYQAATYGGVSNACNDAFGEKIWGKGCQLKVPFCHRLFGPQCNCAVFDYEKYNESRLPERFTEWTALRRVRVHNGLLEELPSGFINLNRVARLEITNNRLKSFDVDVTEWNDLIYLVLYDNEIARMHKSVLRSQSLVNLDVASNVNFSIFAGVKEEDSIHMPSLMYLNLVDNSATIPLRFMGIRQFPRLIFLYLDGNRELQFDVDNFRTLSIKLERLTIGRCNIKKLPSYMPTFKGIYIFDARNNSITQVSSAFLDELKKKDKHMDFEVIFAGNPACQDSKTRKEIRSKVGEKSCEPLCSIYCWSRKVGGNDFCDVSCNSKACYYDGCNLEGCNYDQSDCI